MTNYAINHQTVEQFLLEQGQEEHKSATDVLVDIVLREIEMRGLRRDIKTINKEMTLAQTGKVQLNTLDSLIEELND
jgi:hypothetical protein